MNVTEKAPPMTADEKQAFVEKASESERTRMLLAIAAGESFEYAVALTEQVRREHIRAGRVA